MITFEVLDVETAINDLIASCHGAIYAYGVIAAQLLESDDALDAIARYRIKRDELLAHSAVLGFVATPARAAYELASQITDEASAKVAAALLEESACAHWAAALSYLPKEIAEPESNFLQSCALAAFKWSGIAKAFSST